MQYSYPFPSTASSLFYWTALKLRTADVLEPGSMVEKIEGGVAVCRTPINAAMREQIENLLKQVDAELKRTGETDAPDEKTREMIAKLKDLHDHGVATKLEISTGIEIENASPQFTLTVEKFEWSKAGDGSPVAVPPGDWSDHTTGPVGRDKADLALFSFDEAWQPGHPSGETDERILDLKTGENWRVPFAGVKTVGAAFLPDHQSVVGCCLLTDLGALRPVLIDLKTGKNKCIGGDAVVGGNCHMPAVAADGTKAAVLHTEMNRPILHSRVVVIDLKTGAGRSVGLSVEMGFPSWLPDGSGLVVEIRPDPGEGEHKQTKVAVIKNDGTVVDLFAGREPAVLGASGRVMFRDPEAANQWFTCKIDGSDRKAVGEAVQAMSFPSSATDGSSLLMVDDAKSKSGNPQPVRVDLTDWSIHPLKIGRGFWTIPAW